MQVKIIESADDLNALEPSWNDLLEKCPYRDISYSFQWYSNWVRSFSADKKLRLIVIEKNGQLLAVLPLGQEKVNYSKIQVSVLKSLTNCHSNRFDMLALDDSGQLLATAVAAAFTAGKQQVMVLDHVPANSYIMKWISTVSDEMKWNYTISDHSTNYLVKPTQFFSDYYNSLDGKFRKNVNAAQRKALSRGCLALKQLTAADELEDFLARGFVLEASGWKGDQGTAIVCGNETRQFYDGIARDFYRRGEFQAFLLENNGEDFAFLFCIVGYRVVRALKIGVNDAFRNLGPGMLITREVLEHFHQLDDIDLWDFCGGEARWKRDWGNDTEKLYRIDIFNDGFVGTTFHKLLNLGRDFKRANKLVGKLISSTGDQNKCK